MKFKVGDRVKITKITPNVYDSCEHEWAIGLKGSIVCVEESKGPPPLCWDYLVDIDNDEISFGFNEDELEIEDA